MASYAGICAYTSIYIERVTGGASVDHMVPKSDSWQLVYEWSNYRLACSIMNSRKGVFTDVLDPFTIENKWFELELNGFQVLPGKGVASSLEAQIVRSIERLKLNGRDTRRLRQKYTFDYWNGEISISYLTRRVPFVAMELRRQSRLKLEDM